MSPTTKKIYYKQTANILQPPYPPHSIHVQRVVPYHLLVAELSQFLLLQLPLLLQQPQQLQNSRNPRTNRQNTQSPISCVKTLHKQHTECRYCARKIKTRQI